MRLPAARLGGRHRRQHARLPRRHAGRRLRLARRAASASAHTQLTLLFLLPLLLHVLVLVVASSQRRPAHSATTGASLRRHA